MKKLTLLLMAGALFAGLSMVPSTIKANTLNNKIEPGLWQHSFELASESGAYETMMAEVRQQLEALPAAQRQMMKRMLSEQGISLEGMSGRIEVCLSKNDIAEGLMPQQDGCSQILRPTDNDDIYEVIFSCAADGAKGEGTVTFVDSKNYSAIIDMQVEINGSIEKLTMQQKGEWLGACGT